MRIILSSVLLIFMMSVNAQEFKSPVEYLNYMSEATDNISTATWKYTSAVAHSNSARKIEATRKSLLKNILVAQNKVEAVENGYKGDTEYRDQLIAYLTLSENYLNNQYEEIINMQEVAEQSYDYMEAYVRTRDMINDKIKEEVDKLNVNQKLFADKYGIHIKEDTSELAKKMKISGEVFEYHTEVYLIFFRASITESDLLKAVENKDVSAIQQNIDALTMHASNGLLELNDLKAFKNDNSLIEATVKAMDFYKKEALELGPQLITFFMLNQKLEESKKALESKTQKDLTKAEVDNFNKLVEESNKAVVEYNKQMAKYNNERAVAIKAWNEAGAAFISRHVPKD